MKFVFDKNRIFKKKKKSTQKTKWQLGNRITEPCSIQ